MNDNELAVNHHMVVLARESRGISQSELAESVGVSQGRVSKWEAGLLTLPKEMLSAVANALEYPEEFFTQQGGISGTGLAELFHRKRQDVPKRILDQIYAEIEIRTRHIKSLLRDADLTCTVRHVDIEEFDGDVGEIARQVRASWNLRNGPIHDLTGALENAGVIVIRCDFRTNRVDAISKWMPQLPPMIFINQDMPKDRWRASLAHELGHIVMHTKISPDIEDQAFLFGAEFLLPEAEVRADLYNLDVPKLARLKQYWKVSMNMLLKRAKELGTTTPSQDKYLWAQLARNGYRTREPAALDIGGEEPTLLHELINVHRTQLSYSAAELAKLLTIHPREVGVLYFNEPRRRSLRIVPPPARQEA